MVEPGQVLSHHKLIRRIGKGGMGEVFLALDTKLGRKVALKILPAELSRDPDCLHRFQREARIVASLNHPHIVTIHSVEEYDGIPFITMELVEGVSLDKMLTDSGLPLDQILEIGIALADALAAAHESGVIHRDLKPANIMLNKDQRVKVLDFGLAKLAAESTGASQTTDALGIPLGEPSLTGTGTVLGTVPYMSPEQLQGKHVDQRTDIFALGTVLYQLATGRRPFKGKNSAELVSAIMRDAPPSMTEMRPELPHHFGRIVNHMLAKDPRERFQTARDVHNELRGLRGEIESGELPLPGWRGGGSSRENSGDTYADPDRSTARGAGRRSVPGGWWLAAATGAALVLAAAAIWGLGWNRPVPTVSPAAGLTGEAALTATPAVASVAVLPFANLSGGEEDAYFAEGLSEELRAVLTQIRGLQVAARTSSATFKDSSAGIAEIGRSLHVAHILEGSVRKSDRRLRISARLIKVADGFPLWSENYDRQMDEIFQVQEDVARSVVAALKGPLLGMNEPALHARASNAQAFDLYLQARHSAGRRTPEGFSRAVGYFRESLELDPGYTLAWSGLARAYANQAAFGFISTAEGFAKAREAAEQALSLDSSVPDVHATMAWILMLADWDWMGADAAIRRALTLDPGNVNVINSSASLARTLGRYQEGIDLARRITELDPLSVTARANYGLHLAYAGRHEEATVTLQKVLKLQPGYPAMHMQLGRILLARDKPAEGLEAMKAESQGFYQLFGLALAYHALGDRQQADTALERFSEQNRDHSAYQVAEIYAFRGQIDEAFHWLDLAYRQHDGGLAEMKGDPLLQILHGDPRWPEFLTRMKLPL
ncbi:MAG: protein kinase [Acidobacteria bacterium]|nr:protein kinase [Acidobacteriota bacterium]